MSLGAMRDLPSGAKQGTAAHLLSKEAVIVKGETATVAVPWCEGRLAIAY